MFRGLGDILSRWWILVLSVWALGFIVLRIFSPPFDDIAKGGEFNFLPSSMASRQAEMLFARAFPDRKMTSNVVIVVSRQEKSGLTDADRDFITDKLTPQLETIRDHWNGSDHAKTDGDQPEKPPKQESDKRLITDIRDFSDRGIGSLLTSEDQKASLVTMELALDFQDTRNWGPIGDVENALGKLQSDKGFPKGLQVAVTGSATLGRDLTWAEAESARKTGPLTVGLVIVLLVVIYRAPLMALIPLTTLFVGVGSALSLLTILGSAGYVPLFKGLQEYTTVISYGPGVDYCLFLIARYKENIRACIPPKEALASAIGQVGPAILASGATVICGIGMLTFAQFGKFHEAGIGISVALLVTLIAVLTLTPAMLFMVGHWAFWPKSGVQCDEQADDGSKKPDVAVQPNIFQPMWTYVGALMEKHPLRLLLTTTIAMTPFIVLGFYYFDAVSYGLLESLPKSAPSAVGASILEQHFSAGITGPVQILLQNPKVDFSDDDGMTVVKNLVDGLTKRHEELKIADIRSVATPLGVNPKVKEDESDQSVISRTVERKGVRKHGIEYYVSSTQEFNGHVTEIDVILTANPFAMNSVKDLDRLTDAVKDELPKDERESTTISFMGPTASVRDVNVISHSDQWRIDLLVVSSVLVILMILLRTVAVSVYLLLTVLMSYTATLGVTWLVFYCLDPHGFIGLDWTVPLFLFVVLIAIGEDYNIFLITRIREEQGHSSPKQGIVNALSRTGGIITSCGVIMAGTFSSLCPSALARMHQLGFALAFGVLLDTFVIRPILVPAFLMLMNDERLGRLSRHFR